MQSLLLLLACAPGKIASIPQPPQITCAVETKKVVPKRFSKTKYLKAKFPTFI
jgi:hypothetical protein